MINNDIQLINQVLPRHALIKCCRIAWMAHASQTRDGGEPYFTHPVSVAALMIKHGIVDKKIIIGALLHDSIEDSDEPDKIRKKILKAFGRDVLSLVEGVTNPTYPEAQKPPRKERVEVIVNKIASGRFDSGLIKMGDIEHNTSNVLQVRPKSAESYLREKRKLTDAMANRWEGHPFYDYVRNAIDHRLKQAISAKNKQTINHP